MGPRGARRGCVQRGRRQPRPIPAARAARATSQTCAKPAASTPSASASPTGAAVVAASAIAAIRMTFRRTGAAAGAANRPIAFSTPENSAVRSSITRIAPPIRKKASSKLVANWEMVSAVIFVVSRVRLSGCARRGLPPDRVWSRRLSRFPSQHRASDHRPGRSTLSARTCRTGLHAWRD